LSATPISRNSIAVHGAFVMVNKDQIKGAARQVKGAVDLPLNFHPAAIRASAVSVTP
jgi:hypothetical protein